MIIQLFRTNRPIVFFNLMVYMLLLRGAFLLFPQVAQHGQDSFLAPYIFNWIKQNNIPMWSVQLADMLLTFIEAILINLLMTSHNLAERSSYVPAMVFITLSSIFGPWAAVHLQTVAQLFLIVSIYNIFTLTGKELSRDNIFYTALDLSIGGLFYFPVAIFLPIILFTLILRGYSFLDFLLALAGFVLPYFFIGIGFYYQDAFPLYIRQLEKAFYPKPLLSFDMDILQTSMVIYLLALSLLGFLRMASDTDQRVVKQQRLMFIVLALLVVTVVATPFATGSRLVYLQMLVVPATIFVGRFFDEPKPGIFRNILEGLLLLGVIFFQLYFFHIL